MDGIGPYFSEFIRFVAEIEPSLGFGSAYRQKYSLWEPTAFPLDSTGAFSLSPSKSHLFSRRLGKTDQALLSKIFGSRGEIREKFSRPGISKTGK